ncbi:MAG: magnesium/cobalt transporter CorA [Pseudomonadota bacterium]
MAKKRRKKQAHLPVVAKRHKAPGVAPGTLVARPGALPPAIHVIAYGPDSIREQAIADVSELRAIRQQAPVCWINIEGLGDVEVFQKLGELFDLHPLALEDVTNVHQRPKVEDYPTTDFIVLRMPSYHDRLEFEQISIFLGKGYVITIQERPDGDCLDPVRQRIRAGRGRIRQAGADFLAYSVIDAIVDSYFPILERYGDRLEDVESQVVNGADNDSANETHAVTHDLHALRRVLWPMRDAIGVLGRAPSVNFAPETQLFLRDCYDHSMQLLDIVEACRDLGAGLMNLHVSFLSNRMNEIMKILTLIATIFIPLSFIASVYGMNFDPAGSALNMPELRWRYGYLYALGLMGMTALVLLVFFWRRGWLERPRSKDKGRRDAPDLVTADSSTVASPGNDRRSMF